MADPAVPRLTSVMPGFAVSDLDKVIGYYVEQLGFHLAFRLGNVHAIVARDQVEIGLGLGRPAEEVGKNSCYVKIEGVDALYRELQSKGVRIARELKDESYGMREFMVADPDGNRVCFGEMLED